jgi:hypothetical protein
MKTIRRPSPVDLRGSAIPLTFGRSVAMGFRAEDGTRTRNNQLGRLALYH